MKRLSDLGLAVAAMFLVAAPMFPQSHGAAEEEPLGESVTVVIPRGDHFTVKFWPDRRWYGNSIVGEFVPAKDEVGSADLADLVGVEMDLVRFEFVGPRDEVFMPGLDLNEFNARVGKDLREVERRGIRIAEGGRFRFNDLRAGVYSVRIDWDEVPDSRQHLIATLRYPERASDLQTLLVPAASPAQVTADSGRE